MENISIISDNTSSEYKQNQNNKQTKPKKISGKTVFLVAMLTLPVVHWLVFWLWINIDSLLLAFQHSRGGWTLHNFNILFRELSRTNSIITEALRNTLIFFILNIGFILPVCFFISYFLFRRIAGYKFYRIIFFMPLIISGVVLTTVFSNFIAPNGPIGDILTWAKVETIPEFLANSDYALKTILVYCCWTGFGGSMLLFSGAMSRIPIDVIESARLDGCQAFKEMVSIILPMIWPTLSTMIVFQCTGIFSSSGPILLFTNGQYGTYTLSYWIYEQVYVSNSYNNVAAAGLFFTAIGVPFILIVRRLLDLVPAVEY